MAKTSSTISIVADCNIFRFLSAQGNIFDYRDANCGLDKNNEIRIL